MANLPKLAAPPPPLRTDDDGIVRVGGTRVTLQTLLGAFHDGCSPEEIQLKYPSLDLTDVYAVITYYLWHRESLDAWFEEQERLETDALADLDGRFPTAGIRDRLLARRPARR